MGEALDDWWGVTTTDLGRRCALATKEQPRHPEMGQTEGTVVTADAAVGRKGLLRGSWSAAQGPQLLTSLVLQAGLR